MTTEVYEMKILKPSVDGNWLTNGETFSQQVFLAVGADPNEWWEITSAGYEQLNVLP